MNKDLSSIAYETEIKRLTTLTEKVDNFLNEVNSSNEKNVLYLKKTNNLIRDILTKPTSSLYTNKDKVEDIFKITSDSKKVDNESGFNLDEVLYPKENLDLMELCKELGVTD